MESVRGWASAEYSTLGTDTWRKIEFGVIASHVTVAGHSLQLSGSESDKTRHKPPRRHAVADDLLPLPLYIEAESTSRWRAGQVLTGVFSIGAIPRGGVPRRWALRHHWKDLRGQEPAMGYE